MPVFGEMDYLLSPAPSIKQIKKLFIKGEKLMKKIFSKSQRWTIFLKVFLVLIAIAAGITICLAIWPCRAEEKWKDVLYDLVKSILNVIIVTAGIGLIGWIFEKKFFVTLKNDTALKNAGINEIRAHRATLLDVKKLFGSGSYSYPYEVKIMSVTFNMYLNEHYKNIKKCVEHGCKIKLLLVSKENLNKFITNNEEMKDLKIDTIIKQLENSEGIIDKINDAGKNSGKGGYIEVRYYEDEFRNNFRVSYYNLFGGKEERNYWITLEALKACAKDFGGCITLHGGKTCEKNYRYNPGSENMQITGSEIKTGKEKKENETDSSNIFANYEDGFNDLWEKYEKTAKKFGIEKDNAN